MHSSFPVIVIGSGLAGSECAWQLAKRGIPVTLIEMRPQKMTPAHATGNPAELVCSNSLRSNDLFNAVGLLKEEMSCLDSLIIRAAHVAKVPAGSALAVDREVFSKTVEASLRSMPLIEWRQGEVVELVKNENAVAAILQNGEHLAGSHVVLATGPLTADQLSKWIAAQTGQEQLYFYDSIAPIVDRDSIDMTIAFKGSRYEKGEDQAGDYLNCPMNEAQYENFLSAVQAAELAEVHDFDRAQFFEGCLPIEVMAARGIDTLRFGPMKPVGLVNPQRPEERPHAVVQLRQDNLHATLYNMVGFQTRMKWGEQKRIFRMIPGLEKAEFVRLGSMHRNTYLCSPRVLSEGMELKSLAGVNFAGQITGCEGYVESAAVGLYVGLFLARQILQKSHLLSPPPTTALGALVRHILKAEPEHYQPMNINFGLFDALPESRKKSERKAQMVGRAFADFREWFYGI